MKRFALPVTALVLLSGCSENTPFNSPFEKAQPASAVAKKPGDANYFEMRKEGKVYVFSDIKTMNAFREGKAPARVTTQQLGGKTVVFENRGYTDYNRLVADYKKAHDVQ